jgi:hypothetical protein
MHGSFALLWSLLVISLVVGGHTYLAIGAAFFCGTNIANAFKR